MSGSSRASRVLSRSIVTMDTGINISWDINPDGSNPGTEIHAREEDAFHKIIDEQAPSIEKLFDEMEQSGWRFTQTTDADFYDKSQHIISHGLPMVELSVLSEPVLSESGIAELVGKVARLLKQESFDM